MTGLRRAERATGGLPWIWLCSRLVIAKNPASPVITSQPIGMSRSCDVPDQDLQHLGDPATGRGRVDVPDGAPGQLLPDLVGAPDQLRVPRGADDRLQPGYGQPRHLYRTQQAHGIRLPGRARPSH